MLRQDSRKLQMHRRFGCYFCSLGRIAEKYASRKLSDTEIFNVTGLSIAKGYCNGELFIYNPHEIIKLFLDMSLDLEYEVHYVGWWNDDMDEEFWAHYKVTDTILRYDYGDIYHFKLDYFDPHPGLPLGNLSGKRYFSVRKVH